MRRLRFKDKIKGMSRKKKVIIIICLFLLAAAVAVAVNRCNAPDAEGFAEEEIVSAEVMDIRKTVNSKGEVTSSLEEKVTPHTSYKFEKMAVEKGEEVKEGQPILFYANGGSMSAPYNCVVKNWNLPDKNGKLSNDHYVELAGTDVLRMELSVAEDKIMLVKKGQPATVTIKAADSSYKGEVVFISDMGEYSDGVSTFKVDVLFNNDGSLKLGMNGRAKIVLGQVKNVIGVPVDAIYDDGEASYVTRVKDDGSREDVEVTTGFANSKYIEVKDGLKEGDMIAIPIEEELEEEYYY